MTDMLKAYRRAALKLDYEAVREGHPEAGLKPYDELTDEERARHEAIFDETAAHFKKFGEAISSGAVPTGLKRR